MLRRVLLAGIRFYRRHLSGRGPLQRVRCTFSEQESCSAFAERIMHETPAVWTAMRRVRRRLRRCRHLSLYQLQDHKLGWGSDYDAVLGARSVEEAVRQIDHTLAADGEGTQVRASVVRATALVATATGRPLVPVAGGSPLPVIRSGMAMRQAFTRRYRRRMVVAFATATSGVTAFLCDQGPVVVELTFLLAAVELVLAMNARGVVRRLLWLEVLASIDGPSIQRKADRSAAQPFTSMRTG